MLADKTLTEFVNETASSAPVPGGGGCAAMTGAVGIALGSMVGELAARKKNGPDGEAVQRLIVRAEKLREEFIRLIDADAEAFLPLSEAYRIPANDPERDSIMESALRTAASVPMEIMRTSAKALEMLEEFTSVSTTLSISDAGSGAACCRAALNAASLSVFINTRMMKDREYAEKLNSEADELLARYNALADSVYRAASDTLR